MSLYTMNEGLRATKLQREANALIKKRDVKEKILDELLKMYKQEAEKVGNLPIDNGMIVMDDVVPEQEHLLNINGAINKIRSEIVELNGKITDRRSAAKEIMEARKDLYTAETERLKAVGSLAGDVAKTAGTVTAAIVPALINKDLTGSILSYQTDKEASGEILLGALDKFLDRKAK